MRKVVFIMLMLIFIMSGCHGEEDNKVKENKATSKETADMKDIKTFTGTVHGIINYEKYKDLKDVTLKQIKISEDDDLYNECKYMFYFTGPGASTPEVTGDIEIGTKVTVEYVGEPYVCWDMADNFGEWTEECWMIDTVIAVKGCSN